MLSHTNTGYRYNKKHAQKRVNLRITNYFPIHVHMCERKK